MPAGATPTTAAIIISSAAGGTASASAPPAGAVATCQAPAGGASLGTTTSDACLRARWAGLIAQAMPQLPDMLLRWCGPATCLPGHCEALASKWGSQADIALAKRLCSC
ncbi:hypothetical protein HaLaN_31393, partial [Haematococcus lacustris]